MSRSVMAGANLLALSVGLAACASGTQTGTHAAVSTTRATPPASAPTTSSAPVTLPTLGQMAGIFANGGQGWGQVRPATVFNGGDPTGLVTSITWDSWGGPQATGTGISTYVGPGQYTAQGTQEETRIVAFALGYCGGRYMYEAVEWYFPQHGHSFDPSNYEDICHGDYVGPKFNGT